MGGKNGGDGSATASGGPRNTYDPTASTAARQARIDALLRAYGPDQPLPSPEYYPGDPRAVAAPTSVGISGLSQPLATSLQHSDPYAYTGYEDMVEKRRKALFPQWQDPSQTPTTTKTKKTSPGSTSGPVIG